VDFMPKELTIATRRVAILVTDGFSAPEVEAIRKSLSSAGAFTFIIGPRRGKVKSSSPSISLDANHHFEDQRSTLFDAIFVPGGVEHAKESKENGRVTHWIKEAFGHCKAIGAVGEGGSLPSLPLSLFW
jgi:catalase